jgi:SAM-dependent methyltransferase
LARIREADFFAGAFAGYKKRGKMADTDWIQTWHDLAEKLRVLVKQGDRGMEERWAKRDCRRGYSEDQRNRDRDDPLMRCVLERVKPDESVLDIGAGIGRWSIPMALVCRKVTALDAQPRMLDILRGNAAAENVANIQTILGDWATAEVERHDHVLSSHSAYMSPDILGYARKMERSALAACYMVMRVPRHDGIIGELSRRIHGTFHDSPNFIVGYNALLQAGMAGHVVMEERGRPWHNETLEDALTRARRHLHLATAEYDGLIGQVLEERLVFRDGQYWWPDWRRSALISWRPGRR